MLIHTPSNSVEPPAENSSLTSIGRRQALGQMTLGVMSVFGALGIPRVARADDPVRSSDIYKLRDVDRVYELWARQSKSTHIPPLEVFRDAVTQCRGAACAIFLMRGPRVSASHSGFIVAIPEEHQTAISRGKVYVVTCDHARIEHAGTRPIVQLADGKNIQPQAELVTKTGAKGIPVKDLRIYEFAAGSFEGIGGLRLTSIDSALPASAPVMTYEPLNLRAAQVVDPQNGLVVLDKALQKQPVLEKFILTHVSHPSGFPYDPTYPETSGFRTAGQLKTGGSGSPVILFGENGFTVAGHQVSYGPGHDVDSEDRIDGEIDNDGHVVHINNAINLLQERGRWK